jgi:hypothetical protein
MVNQVEVGDIGHIMGIVVGGMAGKTGSHSASRGSRYPFRMSGFYFLFMDPSDYIPRLDRPFLYTNNQSFIDQFTWLVSVLFIDQPVSLVLLSSWTGPCSLLSVRST